MGPPEEPNQAAELFVGKWRSSLRKAQLTGLRQYFDLYRTRYGFSHPEDPLRHAADVPLYNVISYTDNDSFRYTDTVDSR